VIRIQFIDNALLSLLLKIICANFCQYDLILVIMYFCHYYKKLLATITFVTI